MDNNPENQFNGVPDLSDQFDDAPSLSRLECYYDNKWDRFWLKVQSGEWLPFKVDAVKRKLRRLCQNDGIRAREASELVDDYLHDVQFSNKNIHWAGWVAGHQPGFVRTDGKSILVTRGPELIEPVEGDWPTIREFMESLFAGHRQVEYVYSWMKGAIQALKTGSITQPGQALILAGASGNGKGCFQYAILTPLLGGRKANPNRYLNGNDFNSELIGAEHLLSEDLVPKVKTSERLRLGAVIKELVANESQACHGKGKDAFNVTTFRRLTISINDEDDKLMQLPPMEGDIATKVMLLYTSRASNLMDDRKAFGQLIRSELPAFAHFLEHEFQIPEDLKDHKEKRYGVAAFHHPEFRKRMYKVSDEANYDEVITETLSSHWVSNYEWKGSASDMARRLVDAGCSRDMASSRTVGRMLTKLTKSAWTKDRYEVSVLDGKSIYTIHKNPVQVTDTSLF